MWGYGTPNAKILHLMQTVPAVSAGLVYGCSSQSRLFTQVPK